MAVTTFKNFDGYKNFDWDLLKSFYFIAKSGSFLEASRILGVIQPTFTRQMQALEEQIGFPLLIRHASKGITLTRKGAELVAIVENLMPQLREFVTSLDSITNQPKPRKVRITATHAVAAHIVSSPFLDYEDENPDFTLEVIADDSLTDIVLKDADIGIQTIDPNHNDRKVRGIQADYLFSLEKRLYASPKYIETYGEPQTVKELINHHFLAFPQFEAHPYSHRNWILSLGMPPGELRKPVYTSNAIECMIKAAERGRGILGSYKEYEIIKNSNLKNILPDVKDEPLKTYFIYHDHSKKDKAIMDIRDYLMRKLHS